MSRLPVALEHLCRRLDLNPAALPWDPLWSAAPDFLELLAETVLARRPATILECSSGVTTLVAAAACRRLDSGRVWSLEDGHAFLERTRQALATQELTDYAEVLHAPLVETPLGGRSWQWYDLSGLPDLRAELLVIDGPPGKLQPLSRYPALPRLAGRLAPGAGVLLDDADRPDEQEIVQSWLAEYPGLQAERIPLTRGAVRLTWAG